MAGARRTTRGVLGPLGLLLVTVLWLMTVSGNTPSTNVAAPSSQPVYLPEPIAHIGNLTTQSAPALPGPFLHAPGAGA